MTFLLEIIIGGLFAAAVLYSYRRSSDRSLKSFFAGTLTVAALIYVVFGLFGFFVGTASVTWVLIEFAGLAIYFSFAYIGFRKVTILLSLGWALHVVWDIGLHYSESVQHVPSFYPSMCIGFDLIFAAYIFNRFYLSYRE